MILWINFKDYSTYVYTYVTGFLYDRAKALASHAPASWETVHTPILALGLENNSISLAVVVRYVS